MWMRRMTFFFVSRWMFNGAIERQLGKFESKPTGFFFSYFLILYFEWEFVDEGLVLFRHNHHTRWRDSEYVGGRSLCGLLEKLGEEEEDTDLTGKTVIELLDTWAQWGGGRIQTRTHVTFASLSRTLLCVGKKKKENKCREREREKKGGRTT